MCADIVSQTASPRAKGAAGVCVPDSLANGSSQARNRDWMRTAKPWADFAGLREPESFSIPSVMTWDSRISANMRMYLSNYAILTLALLLLTVITHPSIVVLCGLAGVAFYFASQYISQHNLTVTVNGKRFASQHLNVGFAVLLATAVLYTVGQTVFIFIGISSTIVMVHAFFRRADAQGEGRADETSARAARLVDPEDGVPAKPTESGSPTPGARDRFHGSV